jgi:hypothetical protein
MKWRVAAPTPQTSLIPSHHAEMRASHVRTLAPPTARNGGVGRTLELKTVDMQVSDSILRTFSNGFFKLIPERDF